MRTVLVLAAFAAVAGCTTPLVTKQRMTLGEANIEGLECRRDTTVASQIPRTMCASPGAWARYDRTEADKSVAIVDELGDQSSLRTFYRD